MNIKHNQKRNFNGDWLGWRLLLFIILFPPHSILSLQRGQLSLCSTHFSKHFWWNLCLQSIFGTLESTLIECLTFFYFFITNRALMARCPNFWQFIELLLFADWVGSVGKLDMTNEYIIQVHSNKGHGLVVLLPKLLHNVFEALKLFCEARH